MCGKKRARESGQALLEYILILFIFVLLIMGLIYQFNDAFRQYLNAWFSDQGGYLFCLIENGYLPGETEICTPPTFSLKNGKRLQPIEVSGGANENTNAGGANNVIRPSGGGRVNENAQRLIPASGGGGRGSNLQGSGGIGANGKSVKNGDQNTGNNKFSSSASGGGDILGATNDGSLRPSFVPFNRPGFNGAVKRGTIPATDRDIKSPRLIAAEKEQKKLEELRRENNGFSLSNILKFLVILFIIILIFFFVGSQVVAINRGNRRSR